MNLKKLKIDKDYNRLINILLALYVTLCLIFALLYNGFFINPKAYTADLDSIIKLQFSCDHRQTNNNELRECELTYTFPNIGNGRAIFVNNDVLEEMFENYYNSSNTIYSGSYCLVYTPTSVGSNITASIDGNSQAISSTGDQIVIRNWLNSETSDFTSDQINNISMSVYSNKTVTTSDYTDSFTVNPIGDIEYVDNIEDLYKYLILGDDSVVNNGDPLAPPPEVESSNIPTPQKVQILDNGENPMIVWDNPKSALKFGDKLNVEIQFKPTFSLWQDLSFTESLVCNDWIEAFKDKLDNHNAFCILKNSDSVLNNNLNGYNIYFDDNYIFDTKPVTDYAKSYIKMVIDKNGETSLVPYGVGDPPNQAKKMQKKLNAKSGVVGGDIVESVWETLAPEALATIKGLFNGGTVTSSNFRIRYSCHDGNKILVSPWVNASRQFNDDSTPKSDTDISFSDKDDTPIQNPTYLPANTTNVNSLPTDPWWLNFNDYSGTMFDNLTQQMSDWTGDTGGFVGFFGELFNEFPFLSWCLLFSLTLAIFLRIFGR